MLPSGDGGGNVSGDDGDSDDGDIAGGGWTAMMLIVSAFEDRGWMGISIYLLNGFCAVVDAEMDWW